MEKYQTHPFNQWQTQLSGRWVSIRTWIARIPSETKLIIRTMELSHPNQLLSWSSPGILRPVGEGLWSLVWQLNLSSRRGCVLTLSCYWGGLNLAENDHFHGKPIIKEIKCYLFNQHSVGVDKTKLLTAICRHSDYTWLQADSLLLLSTTLRGGALKKGVFWGVYNHSEMHKYWV